MPPVPILSFTVVERYSFDRADVLNRGAAMFPDLRDSWMSDDDFIQAVFDHLNGSAACDELFYNDANPDVFTELSERDDDA